MKFAELKKHLQDGPVRAAYLVTGDDAFVMQSAVGHFLRTFPVLPELNVSVFCDTADACSVTDACETLPVAAPMRLVLCYDFKGDGAEFVKYLARPNPSAVLVFVTGKLTEHYAKIVSALEIVDCNRLSDDHITKWISGKLRETNTRITAAAVGTLLEYCRRDLTRISKETEKLGVFRLEGEITKEDVQGLVAPDEEYKIFDLSDAVSAKDGARAAAVLKSLLTDSGVSEINLLGMLYAHFRRLLYCAVNPKDEGLAKKLGVKEYAVKIALGQAKRFSVLRLKQICDDFHRTDFAVKSGAIGARLGLETYILKILVQ